MDSWQDLTGFLLGLIVSLFVAVASQISLMRWTQVSRILTLVSGFFVGNVLAVIYFFSQAEFLGVALVFFNSSFVLYFHFINIAESSVRLRILNEIRQNPGMEVADIRKKYEPTDILDARLQRLSRLDQIEIDAAEQVRLKRGEFLFLARVIGFLKDLYFSPRSSGTE